MSETTSVSEDLGGGAEVAPAVDTPETPPSLRESMEAAYDAVEAREKDPEAAPAPGPARGPDGKFAPKPVEAEPVATEPAAAAPVEPAAPAAAEIPPPEGWGDKAKVDWNRLPASVRAEIAQRTSAPDPIRAVAQEFAADIAAVGHPPEALFRSLLVAERELRTNPVEALKWLARSYSVDLTKLAPAQQAASQPYQAGAADPQVEPWQAKIADLETRLQQTHQLTVAQQQAALQRQQAEAAEQIQAFATGKPHFETVKQDMALLIREGRAKDLAEAYEMAQWANPVSRAALLQEQQQAAEAKRAADAAARIATARKATGVNVRGSTGAAPAPPRSMRESLEAAYDAANS